MRKLIAIFVILFMFSACTAEASQNAISSADALQTESAQPSETPEPTQTLAPSPTYTETLEPTLTETPTITPSPSATTVLCTNQAEFIRHLSISENTKLKIGTYFAKVWLLKNIGTCTWDENYALVFQSGEQMGSPDESPLPGIVLPGDSINLQITLLTPMQPDTYTGLWMLRDPSGQLFGSGENADQPLSTIIIVEEILENKRLKALDCGG